MNEARKKEEYTQSRQNDGMQNGSYFDPVQTMTDEHKRQFGYFRMRPNRPLLIPHKISFGDVFGDQAHMTVDRRPSHRSTSRMNTSMQLADLTENKQQLSDVESMQLLSSMVIRAIQVHRKHEPFIPGALTNMTDSSSNFADALAISQMHLHSSSLNGFQQSSFQLPNRLPPIIRRRPSSAQASRDRADAMTRAARAGSWYFFRILRSTFVNVLGVNVRKAQDMEDLLSNLLKPEDRQVRSTLAPHSTPHPAPTPDDTGESEVTHARLLENCKHLVIIDENASILVLSSVAVSRQVDYTQSDPTDSSRLSEIRTSTEFKSTIQSDFRYFEWSSCQTTRLDHWQHSCKGRFHSCFVQHAHSILYRTIQHHLWKKSQRNAGKHLSSFFQSSALSLWILSHPRPLIPPFDDEHSSNFFDYAAPIHLTAMQQQQREEQFKKNLPPVRGPKMSVLLCFFFWFLITSSRCRRLPRHVLKFGFREIEMTSPEASIESLRDENVSKSRRRRIYMHLMVSVSFEWLDQRWLSPPSTTV